MLNIDLLSARIPFAPLRQPLVLLEFLLRSRALMNRLQPDYLFTFYNSAAILLRIKWKFPVRKVAWLLDFRHPYFLNWRHRMLERIGEADESESMETNAIRR